MCEFSAMHPTCIGKETVGKDQRSFCGTNVEDTGAVPSPLLVDYII